MKMSAVCSWRCRCSDASSYSPSCFPTCRAFVSMKNSRETDCNGLTLLIHLGLVQVHQATKTRHSKPVCVFPLSLTTSSTGFLYFVPDRRQFSEEAAAANPRALKSFFLPMDYFSPCSNLKSTGYQGDWKPLLLPCVFCGQQENVRLLLWLAAAQTSAWL